MRESVCRVSPGLARPTNPLHDVTRSLHSRSSLQKIIAGHYNCFRPTSAAPPPPVPQLAKPHTPLSRPCTLIRQEAATPVEASRLLRANRDLLCPEPHDDSALSFTCCRAAVTIAAAADNTSASHCSAGATLSSPRSSSCRFGPRRSRHDVFGGRKASREWRPCNLHPSTHRTGGESSRRKLQIQDLRLHPPPLHRRR